MSVRHENTIKHFVTGDDMATASAIKDGITIVNKLWMRNGKSERPVAATVHGSTPRAERFSFPGLLKRFRCQELTTISCPERTFPPLIPRVVHIDDTVRKDVTRIVSV